MDGPAPVGHHGFCVELRNYTHPEADAVYWTANRTGSGDDVMLLPPRQQAVPPLEQRRQHRPHQRQPQHEHDRLGLPSPPPCCCRGISCTRGRTTTGTSSPAAGTHSRGDPCSS